MWDITGQKSYFKRVSNTLTVKAPSKALFVQVVKHMFPQMLQFKQGLAAFF